MAVDYRSSATAQTGAATETISINKPSNLAVGDTLIAVVFCPTASVTYTAGTSGFVELNDADSVYVAYKVATSSDVAASSFGFTASASNNGMVGALVAISGASSISPIWDALDSTAVENDATPSFAGGIDPTDANTLLLFFATAAGTATDMTSTSNFAITTSNPTWTSRFDVTGGSGNSAGLSLATGPRPETTATGDYSCTLNGTDANVDSRGILLCVTATDHFAHSASVLSVQTVLNAPTVTAGSTVTPSVFSLPIVLNAPTVTSQEFAVFTSATKTSATGSALSKNSATFSAASKTSSTWSAEAKTQ